MGVFNCLRKEGAFEGWIKELLFFFDLLVSKIKTSVYFCQ